MQMTCKSFLGFTLPLSQSLDRFRYGTGVSSWGRASQGDRKLYVWTQTLHGSALGLSEVPKEKCSEALPLLESTAIDTFCLVAITLFTVSASTCYFFFVNLKQTVAYG